MTDYGGDGTLAELEWAQIAAAQSYDCVSESGAWAVTQGTGRQVSTAGGTGYAYAKGVLSKSAGTILTSLSTPTNGQWFLIVRRITWTGTGTTTTVAAIAHSTTSTTLPTAPPSTYPTFNASPGADYDHKLAWAWVRSSDTTMVLFDLRMFIPGVHVWMAPTLGSGWSATAGRTVGISRVGDVIWWKGEILNGSLGVANLIFTLESRFWPVYRQAIYIADLSTGTTDGVLNIDVDGTCYVARGNGGATSPGLSLNHISYLAGIGV